MGLPNQENRVSRPLEVGRDRLLDVYVVPKKAEQESGWNADLLASQHRVVLHRVLATDAWKPVGPADIVESPVGPNQLGELVSPIRGLARFYGIWPAEVIETRYHL